jgi:hypothetical protein
MGRRNEVQGQELNNLNKQYCHVRTQEWYSQVAKYVGFFRKFKYLIKISLPKTLADITWPYLVSCSDIRHIFFHRLNCLCTDT